MIGIGIAITQDWGSGSAENWTYVTSGLDWYRKGLRSGKYVIDYSSDGGVTYELDLVSLNPTEDVILINIDAGVAGYRQQVRNGALMIDHVLTETGFAGVEGTDWENIDSYAPDLTLQTPTNLTLYSLDEKSIGATWDDAAVAATGLKLYISTDNVNFTLKDTIAFGVEESYATGLTANTLYYFRLVAYLGSNESVPLTGSISTLVKWFLEGGVAAGNAIGAYNPIEASSLSASYVNKANPGTYDIIELTAPTLVAGKGWQFNIAGLTKLNTGIIPANNQTFSMIIRYEGFVIGAAEQGLGGQYTGASKMFYLGMGRTGAVLSIYANGGARVSGYSALDGVNAICGDTEYVSFTETALKCGAGVGNNSYPITLGAVVNGVGTYAWYFGGIENAVAIYDKVISAAELNAIGYRMKQLGKPVGRLKKRCEYMTWEFGLDICFSIATFNAGVGLTDGDVNLFNPTDLDIDEWLDTAVTAGMGYAVLPAKFEDGFCLYPSEFADPGHSPYTIAQTTWYAAHGNMDIMAEVIAGLRARNMGVVLYYSIRDTTHEARTGTDETTDPTAYIAMINTQLTEILTNYGPIDALWIDDWAWHVSYLNIPFDSINETIKSIQPNCILVINDHTHPTYYGDIEEFESEVGDDGHVAEGNIRFSEEIETMRTDLDWLYKSFSDNTAAAMKDKATINAAVAQANARTANYLLGVQIDTTGHIVASQKTILESLTT